MSDVRDGGAQRCQELWVGWSRRSRTREVAACLLNPLPSLTNAAAHMRNSRDFPASVLTFCKILCAALRFFCKFSKRRVANAGCKRGVSNFEKCFLLTFIHASTAQRSNLHDSRSEDDDAECRNDRGRRPRRRHMSAPQGPTPGPRPHPNRRWPSTRRSPLPLTLRWRCSLPWASSVLASSF